MAATKILGLIHGIAGKTIYCTVKYQADDTVLDNDDGTFKAFGSVTTLENPLTADANQTRLYEFSENRAVWSDGEYIVLFYLQAGGSPAIATDKIISAAVINIDTDVATFRPYHTSQGVWQNAVRTITSVDQTITGITVAALPDIDSLLSELEIFRGDAVTINFAFGTNVDLTDRLVNFMAKNFITDADGSAVIDVSCAITDASNGEGNVSLTAAHTATAATLFAEFEARDDPADTNPATLSQFKLIIKPDVRTG